MHFNSIHLLIFFIFCCEKKLFGIFLLNSISTNFKNSLVSRLIYRGHCHLCRKHERSPIVMNKIGRDHRIDQGLRLHHNIHLLARNILLLKSRVIDFPHTTAASGFWNQFFIIAVKSFNYF